MTNLDPSEFFDLSTYEHKALFDLQKPVWAALSNIDLYLSKKKLGHIEIEIPEGAYLVDPHLISIGKGSVVEPGAYIKGPCVIGSKCTIRHGAYIRGHVITGNHCVIGHDTEVKHSILLDHSVAAHFTYLGDSIIGNRVNLGAGTKCSNLKLNNGNIVVILKGEKIDTGQRKLGAIIGDDSQLGCNTVTNPGTFFGKNVWCYPITNVGGVVPSGSTIKTQSPLVFVSRKCT